MKVLLTESQYQRLNEIDWEGEFSDVKSSCLTIDGLVDYLNNVKINKRGGLGMPFIHSKSGFIKEFDKITEGTVEEFARRITQEPRTVIGKNAKMKKSGSETERVFNTGIPAVAAIVYDIEHGEFHKIRTCPGMGSCVNVCYALKGNYIRFPNVYDSMIKRVNLLMNNPGRYKERLIKELYNEARIFKAISKNNFQATNSIVLRWNDSGDFFGKRYLQIAQEAMKELRAMGVNIVSTSYSKIADVAYDKDWEDKFDSRSASTGSNKKETAKFSKYSEEQPNKVKSADIGYGDKYGFNKTFSDFDRTNAEDREKLKIAVSKVHGYPYDTVIYYDEIINMQDNKIPFWNVIVLTMSHGNIPGDGDRASWRGDVKSINNLLH